MKTATKNINSKKVFSSFFIILFLGSFFIITKMVSAAEPIPTQTGTYTLLAPLPIGDGGSNTGTVTLGGEEAFANYLNSAFKIGITIAILLAVIMIVIGGIQWMGESVFGKESGKKKIQDAMIGLVLALAIFLILNTINPDLVNLRLKVDNLVQPPALPPASTTVIPGSGGVVYKACADCATVASLGLPTKPPSAAGGSGSCLSVVSSCEINRDLGARLQEFKGFLESGISWTISESWPPTRTHKEPGQQDGTSVDISTSSYQRDNLTLTRVIEAARRANLRAQYEVTTKDEETRLRGQGINALYVQGITGNHFSIYKI